MPLGVPMSWELLGKRLKENRSAEKALSTLVLAGCHRGTLLLFLRGAIPSLRSWSQFKNRMLPAPKQLGAMAEKLERTSSEIAAGTEFIVNLPYPKLRSQALTVAKQLQNLAMSLRILARDSHLRTIRNWHSYRNMGRIAQTAALCHYVKTRTRKPHYREIADLLAAVRHRAVAEDALRHQVERATKKLEYDRRFWPVLTTFVFVLEDLAIAREISGREPDAKISR